MKLGQTVFDDDFISFSENKGAKFGYAPVSGLTGLSENCILVECDPEAPARNNCERTCFSDPGLCKCRCGTCYDKFCECGSPTPAEGLYEDYLARIDAYNFGVPRRFCPVPEQAPLLAMEGSASPATDCNCRDCPESGKPPPDPEANPAECCKEALEIYGPCTCLQEGGCGSVVVYRFGETNETRTVSFGEEAPYYWGKDTENPENPGCYKCKCPEPMAPKGDKKYWKCPQGDETECQETEDPNGTYESPELCNEKVTSGDCLKKFIGLWNDHAGEGGAYQCREKPENFQWVGNAITEYDTYKDCEDDINAKQGSCGAYSTPTSTVYTGLGHCDHKWKCDASRVQNSGDPWDCRKTPFINGSDLYENESECKKKCCNGDFGESIGRCFYDEGAFGALVCVVESRSQCAGRNGDFSCGVCTKPPDEECDTGTSDCPEGKILSYKFYGGVFSNTLECLCVDDPNA